MDPLHHMGKLHGRVHAASFGYSRPEHVTNPLKIMRADAFVLLENRNDQALAYHRKRRVDLHKQLDKTGVPWERVEVDLWRPAAVGGVLRRIVARHQLPELLVNASVGPNTVAVGAALASLFAPIRLYHPLGESPSEPLDSLEHVSYLPSFRVGGWKAEHVSILEVLADLDGKVSGEALKRELRRRAPQVIGEGKGAGNWAQREHARFQALVEFLEESKSLEIRRAHRRWDISLTESGRHMASLLGATQDNQDRRELPPTAPRS